MMIQVLVGDHDLEKSIDLNNVLLHLRGDAASSVDFVTELHGPTVSVGGWQLLKLVFEDSQVVTRPERELDLLNEIQGVTIPGGPVVVDMTERNDEADE